MDGKRETGYSDQRYRDVSSPAPPVRAPETLLNLLRGAGPDTADAAKRVFHAMQDAARRFPGRSIDDRQVGGAVIQQLLGTSGVLGAAGSSEETVATITDLLLADPVASARMRELWTTMTDLARMTARTDSALAPHELIAQSQGLVRALALKVYGSLPRAALLEDLIGYGQLGLAQAAQSYQPESGAAFSTFAYYRVRGAIYDGLALMSGCPRHVRRRILEEKRAVEHLAEDAAAGLTQTDLASDCQWLLETTQQLATILLATAAAEAVADDEEGPDVSLERRETIDVLTRAVDELPEPDVSVVRLAYFGGLTLTEIAGRYGKDKSWASRVHSQAVKKLAKRLAASGVG